MAQNTIPQNTIAPNTLAHSTSAQNSTAALQRITIFGATGATGRLITQQAIERGFIVRAFVRSEAKLGKLVADVEVVTGDVLDKAAVRAAIDGQDAVVIALGAPASSKARLRTRGTENILSAMKSTGVSRLSCLTVMGANESFASLPWHLRNIIVPLYLKRAFRDHDTQEQAIRASGSRFTLVRPPFLTDGPKTESYQHGTLENAKLKYKVSRADVAHFMLEELESGTYVGSAAGISY